MGGAVDWRSSWACSRGIWADLQSFRSSTGKWRLEYHLCMYILLNLLHHRKRAPLREPPPQHQPTFSTTYLHFKCLRLRQYKTSWPHTLVLAMIFSSRTACIGGTNVSIYILTFLAWESIIYLFRVCFFLSCVLPLLIDILDSNISWRWTYIHSARVGWFYPMCEINYRFSRCGHFCVLGCGVWWVS